MSSTTWLAALTSALTVSWCGSEGIDATAPDGQPHIIDMFTLSSASLRDVDTLLDDADLDRALANGAGTVTAPSIGSGIDFVSADHFAMITDRGPNGDHHDGGKFFPLASFTPSIVLVRTVGADLEIEAALPIVDDSGAPVTGLSNTANDDVPFATERAVTPLDYDENGLDTEELRVLPNGDVLVVDEYAPSLVLIDGATGQVRARYTPHGVVLPNANYQVRDILPSVFTERRPNKGFESLALGFDAAYLITQTALGDEDTFKNCRVMRVLRIDHPSDPENAVVGAQWFYLAGHEDEYPSTKQKKVYANAADIIDGDRLLILERGDENMKLIVLDFAAATNVGESYDDLGPESDGLEALGLVPATREEVFDSRDVAGIPEKMEGLTIMNPTTVAVANDNDFGIVDASDLSRTWIIRLARPL